MADDTRDVVIRISAKNLVGEAFGQAKKEVGGLQKSIGDFGRGATSAGRALLPFSAAIGAVGFGAVKMATDLNAGMANVASLIPGNTARVHELKTAVQEMAIATGKSTTDLTAGLYQTVSAFGDTSDTAKILNINARAAAAGLATTLDAINLTSAVTKAYGDTSAAAVQKASDLAFVTVKLGQTTFPELASAIGLVAPIAATLKVRQEELSAGFATLTGVTGSASQVATQMRAVLASMLKPTKEMETAIAALGFSSSSTMVEQLGMVGAMNALIGTTDGSEKSVGKLFGSVEGLSAVFALTGGQADTFTSKLAEMEQASGATDEAFREQTEGVNAAGFAWEQFKARMQVTMQKLGDTAIPILMSTAEALKPLLDKVIAAVDWFGKLPQPVQTVGLALAGLAVAAAPVLLAIGTMARGISALLPVLGGLTTAFSGAAGLTAAITGSTIAMGGLTAGLAGIVVPLALMQVVKLLREAKWYWDDLAQRRLDVVAEGAVHMRAMAEASKIAGREITELTEAHSILRAEALGLQSIQRRGFDVMQGGTIHIRSLAENLDAIAGRTKAALAGLTTGTDAATASTGRLTTAQKEAAKAEAEYQEVISEARNAAGLAWMEQDKKDLDAALARKKANVDGLAHMESDAAQMQAAANAAAYAERLRIDDAYYQMRSELANQAGLALMAADAERLKTTTQKMFAGFGEMLKGIGPTIMSAFTGGGDVMKSLGGLFGGQLGTNLGNMLGKKIGGTIGSSIGSMIPGLGTMLGGMAGSLIGPLIGKIGSFFKNLFGPSENFKTDEIRGAWERTIDLEALQQKVNQAQAAGFAAQEAYAQVFSATSRQAFEQAKDRLLRLLEEAKNAKVEMGRPIVIPIEYQISGAPSGDGGGSSAPPSAAGNTDALFREKNVLGAYSQDHPDQAGRIKDWLATGGRGDESRAPGDLGLEGFWEWFNQQEFRGAAGGGVYAKPTMRVIAERSPEIVGDANTIVSALAQAMQRVGFGDTAGGGATVHFNLTTPLATVDTIRQMVYAEIGPLLVDWINGNKHGARTQMRTALGIA